MKIKAIVLDIDGTLLTDDRQISDATITSLRQQQEKGVKVILASGRPTSGMMPFIKALEIDRFGGYLVSYNGASVYACREQEEIFIQALPISASQQILEHLKQFDLIPMIAHDDYLYVNDVYNGMLSLENGPFNIIEYEARGGRFKLCEKHDLAAFATMPLHKILVAGQPDYIQRLEKELREPFGDTVTASYSAPFYFEYTDKGVDKAQTLAKVFQPMGILPENIVAFGDGHNDLTMIQYAKYGIAMGNAIPELKENAYAITKSNNDDGIAIFLNEGLNSIETLN